MKELRKRELGSWSRFFWCAFFVVFSCVVVTGVTFSTFTIFGERFRPVLVSSWRKQAMEALSGDSFVPPAISIRADQELVFLKYPRRLAYSPKMTWTASTSLPTRLTPTSSYRRRKSTGRPTTVRWYGAPAPSGFTLSLGLRSNFLLRPGPTNQWNSLSAHRQGQHHRGFRERSQSPSRQALGLQKIRMRVQNPAEHIEQFSPPQQHHQSVGSDEGGKGIPHSVTEPKRRSPPDLPIWKQHDMCICTMVRNQARFLQEWIMYHARIGVQRWFIYDNNSVDNMEKVLESLQAADFNISRHLWPWIKTQEAGFAYCALRARDSCEWVGFIDVDEFLHLPSGMSLQDVLANHSSSGKKNVAELRVSCYSFGPSGLTSVPPKGVAVGYTCRLAAPERHKSIVRPEALNSTLVVHHFHLRSGFNFANADKGAMVINHYKYQVWDVFKEKFYRRVAAYVADRQNEENAGPRTGPPVGNQSSGAPTGRPHSVR